MKSKAEYDLQVQVVEWFNLAYPELAKCLHHSPNGEVRPSKTYTNKRGETKRYCPAGQRLKKMGTKPGFPDLVLYYPSSQYIGFACEVKKTGEKLSDDQFEWLKILSACRFYVSWGDNLDFIRKEFQDYLKPLIPRVKF